MNFYTSRYRDDYKRESNWDAAKLPKLAKRSTFTPKMNNKTKRY
jgi:hypothetical protein